MQLNGVASSILVGWFLVLSVVVLVVLSAMAYVLWRINVKIEQLSPKVEPLLDKVDRALTSANDQLTSLGDRAEQIVARGEDTTVSVYQKVEKTAVVVQRAVNAPIVNLNSFVAGLSRAYETFNSLQQQRNKSRGDKL